jgi:UbiD family decarboxylase
LTVNRVTSSARRVDLDEFRLRRFVDRLTEMGEVEVHDEPISLADLSSVIEASPKALLFRNVGAERYEMVAGVNASRRRLAAAFGVGPREVMREYLRRMANPQPIVEVPSTEAPVHAVVKTGDEVDLSTLPFHIQHEFDGGPYISSGMDFTIDPASGKTNVGCRRLMLRGRREMGAMLSQPSDLKDSYLRCVARGEQLPASYVIGSHPLNYLAAGLRLPVDEFGLVATLRGKPLPMVRGLTNGVLAPADAEIVVEGYFDERGHREMEGPYGEFYGFYGPPHVDPVFHVTAITMRKDPLHQTVLHSARYLSWTDSANLGSLNAEYLIWQALRALRIEPAAVHSVPASNGRQHVRVALHEPRPGQARAVISALFALVNVKHVFVVEDDVDVFSDEEMELALASRFRADRDLIVLPGVPGFYAEPTGDGDGTITKAGFDLTRRVGKPGSVDSRRAYAPKIERNARCATVRTALEGGPLYFAQLMSALGSRDGREVALELERLRLEDAITRLPNGEWALKTGAN